MSKRHSAMPAPLTTGTYVLILQCQQTAQLPVGKLGLLKLRPGYYLYVGSAFGPGGIPARIAHHKRIQRSPHWHIDYLRKETALLATWHSFDTVKREHQWAAALAGETTCSMAMPRFGASDCKCPGHLFYSVQAPQPAALEKQLRRMDSEQPALQLTICNGEDTEQCWLGD